jgi:hypothetical protein
MDGFLIKQFAAQGRTGFLTGSGSLSIWSEEQK